MRVTDDKAALPGRREGAGYTRSRGRAQSHPVAVPGGPGGPPKRVLAAPSEPPSRSGARGGNLPGCSGPPEDDGRGGQRTMAEARGSGRFFAPVDGLGAWDGLRPTLCLRVRTAVGAFAYLAHVVSCAVS